MYIKSYILKRILKQLYIKNQNKKKKFLFLRDI